MINIRSIKLYNSVVICSLAVGVVSGCANGPLPCESIVEVNRQHQECTQLRKTMGRTNYPQQALTAKKRFEANCQDLRYYRDEYDTICKGGQKPIGEEKSRD